MLPLTCQGGPRCLVINGSFHNASRSEKSLSFGSKFEFVF